VLTSVSEVSAWLAKQSGGQSAAAPLGLKLNFSMGTMTEETSGWQQLLAAINAAGKFVTLDLSACTMSGTGFDPDKTVTIGKDKITGIVLPNTARTIAAGTDLGNPAFKGFTGLKSIAGAGITTVGNFAFAGCTGLTSVSLPVATSIGQTAFFNCTSLTSVSFPASATLGANPFAGCTALSSITLTGAGALSVIESGKALVKNSTELVGYPAASGSITLNSFTTIGHGAFTGCTSLTSVSFPAAGTIGDGAFYGCTSLTSVSFPAAGTIGDWAFADTGTAALSITLGATAPTLQHNMFEGVAGAKTVTVRVPGGSTGNYNATWQTAFKGKGSDNIGDENANITVIITEI
jgi:hypothetical protein